MFSNLDCPAAFLCLCNPFHVGTGIDDRAEGIKVIEDRRSVIDRKADLGNLAVNRGDVLVTEEGEVRKDTAEMVALLASSPTAGSRHCDAVDQRDLRPVVKHPGDVFARMRVEEQVGVEIERGCAALERKFPRYLDAG